MLLTAACTSLLADTTASPVGGTAPPLILTVGADGMHQLDLRVMTFNVAGLPQPIRRTRDDALSLIGEELRRQRLQGTAPHIVVVQEAFTDDARAIGRQAGYAFERFGPDIDSAAPYAPATPAPALLAKRHLHKGEGFGKVLGGGLAIFSDLPISTAAATAFGARDCAGTDCLANKGVLLANVRVPGIASGIDIATTHMNSFKDAGKPYARSLIAHQRQSDTVSAFLRAKSRADAPLILAGDFNAAETYDRHAYLARQLRLQQEVMESCARSKGCLLALGKLNGPFWQSSLDLQWLRPGGDAAVAPVKVNWAFDQPVAGTRVSDHKALMVTYRIRWRPRTDVALNR